MPTNIEEIARIHETALSAELNLARATFDHAGQKGNSLEKAVQAMLQRFLPKKVGVTEGVVIDSDGFISSQLDIILYDRIHAQLFYGNGGTSVVPAEFVFAVGEVKATLTHAGYAQAFEAQQRVKQARRHLAAQNWTYHGYGKTWQAPPIASFLIGFEGDKSNVHDWALESHKNFPINDCLDAILVPETFFTARASEYGPDMLQGRMKSLETTSAHSLYRFLGMLAKAAAEWHMRETAEMYRYFMSVGGIPNSTISTLDPDRVVHPYLSEIVGRSA